MSVLRRIGRRQREQKEQREWNEDEESWPFLRQRDRGCCGTRQRGLPGKSDEGEGVASPWVVSCACSSALGAE